jgi:hypothetical protein
MSALYLARVGSSGIQCGGVTASSLDGEMLEIIIHKNGARIANKKRKISM